VENTDDAAEDSGTTDDAAEDSGTTDDGRRTRL
jgi:hypothetical protein